VRLNGDAHPDAKGNGAVRSTFCRGRANSIAYSSARRVKDKIEPAVIQSFSETPQKLVSVIIQLKDKADLESIVDRRDSKSLNEVKLHREEVVQALKETAARSQAPVLALLNQGVQAQEVSKDVVSFFIINAIAATINQDMLVKLAELPQVEHIYPDVVIQIPPEEMKAIQVSDNDVDVSGVAWGVAKIRADKVWNELGITGKGIVVGSIDTGVDRDHPALKDKYRGNRTYQVYSFHDFVDMKPIPYDDHGHGTHVMGIIMGDGGEMQKIGIAPGAEWIAAKAIDAQGYGFGRTLLMAMEWIMAPEGVARLAPDIVSNSWGGTCDSRDVFFSPSCSKLACSRHYSSVFSRKPRS
jgi:bacillopeptidase F